MRLLACLIVAPQRGYDEPAILFAMLAFILGKSAALPIATAGGYAMPALIWRRVEGTILTG